MCVRICKGTTLKVRKITVLLTLLYGVKSWVIYTCLRKSFCQRRLYATHTFPSEYMIVHLYVWKQYISSPLSCSWGRKVGGHMKRKILFCQRRDDQADHSKFWPFPLVEHRPLTRLEILDWSAMSLQNVNDLGPPMLPVVWSPKHYLSPCYLSQSLYFHSFTRSLSLLYSTSCSCQIL